MKQNLDTWIDESAFDLEEHIANELRVHIPRESFESDGEYDDAIQSASYNILQSVRDWASNQMDYL